MANKKFWLGILAMVLLFGMALIGCDNGSTNGGGGGEDNPPVGGSGNLAGTAWEITTYIHKKIISKPNGSNDLFNRK